ncbi:Leucine-rich repeat receptor protein kinase EMS1 [Hondaea fermentalgiana]|uniref:Leucine-rich repeat receptor protein kinase EMS1 n=1 Tax=Hondaea fermentalgiana TaxID=2315210 RepID=A0A2R5G661_9STRA|nr:Leucine-rich repeat receptor protein kinase EMS1 [Hondaea fermentalgiana]|eukprot:GBG26526.1 Leucine-rich repeat receptor protein kinase EMS1 [Hondaea fermentalgiana]
MRPRSLAVAAWRGSCCLLMLAAAAANVGENHEGFARGGKPLAREGAAAEENLETATDVQPLQIGQRVRRGADWVWYRQDGVPPGPGTVVQVVDWKNEQRRGIRVLWDATDEWNVYRWGAEDGRFDLKVLPDEPLVDLEALKWRPPPEAPSGACVPNEKAALSQLYRNLNGPTLWRHKAGWETLDAQVKQECTEEGLESGQDETMMMMMMVDNLGQRRRISRAAQGGYDRPRPEDADDPCLLPWEGVVCEKGHVVSLRLDRNHLRGSLASLTDLGALSNLRALDLSMNALNGSLDAITMLSNLRWLNLANNQLSGTIPDALGDLVELEWISVAHNQLEGALPASLGQLKNLSFAFFSQNRLQVSENMVPQSTISRKLLSKYYQN